MNMGMDRCSPAKNSHGQRFLIYNEIRSNKIIKKKHFFFDFSWFVIKKMQRTRNFTAIRVSYFAHRCKVQSELISTMHSLWSCVQPSENLNWKDGQAHDEFKWTNHTITLKSSSNKYFASQYLTAIFAYILRRKRKKKVNGNSVAWPERAPTTTKFQITEFQWHIFLEGDN